MEFLSEYYLWFVVGGIILLMALIGYIADKTDFGRKDITTNQNKKEPKIKDDTVNEVIENQTIPSEIKEEVPTIEAPSMEKVEDVQMENQGITDDNNSISDIDPFVMPNIEEPSLEPIVENNVEINTPNNDEEIEIKEVTDDSIFTLNNDLSPFAATELVNPIGSADLVNNTVSEVIGENIPVQSTNDKTNEVVSDPTVNQEIDEDIWKF